MKLLRLQLLRFRNFSDELFVCHPHVNFFVGENAQGKTNILEAIFLLAHAASFRTDDRRDLIARDATEARVLAEVQGPLGKDEWCMTIHEEKKQTTRNGKNLSLRGPKRLGAILFSPDDTLLFKDTPGERRRYMDRAMGLSLPGYGTTLRSYARVVTQRNCILSDPAFSQAECAQRLEEWNEKLVEEGMKVVALRQEWTEKMQGQFSLEYRKLASPHDPAAFIYKPFLEDVSSDSFFRELSRRFVDERARRVSLVGPHRDDFMVTLGGEDIQHFGSQGEHRTAVLALKIAEVEMFRVTFEEPPILLLDDVASELDHQRCASLFSCVQHADAQVFISATSVDAIPPELRSAARQWRIRGGRAFDF